MLTAILGIVGILIHIITKNPSVVAALGCGGLSSILLGLPRYHLDSGGAVLRAVEDAGLPCCLGCALWGDSRSEINAQHAC